MMDNFVICAVEEAFSWGLPTDAGAVLIVELDGVEAGMSDEADQIIRILEDHHTREVRTARMMRIGKNCGRLASVLLVLLDCLHPII